MEESLIKKIVNGALVVFSLLLAIAFYYVFDLENIFYERQQEVVSQAEIEQISHLITLVKKQEME